MLSLYGGIMAKIIKFPTHSSGKNGLAVVQHKSNEEIDWDIPLEVSPEEEQLNLAQDIIYDAWEADTPEQKIALAKQALLISPNCVDAYNILAHYSTTTYDESLKLYEKGIAIAESLYENPDTDNYIAFGRLTNRPYLRSRVGAIECLLALGCKNKAIKNCKELLKIDTRDGHGIRYVLLPLLIETSKDKQAETLLKRYKDDCSAYWFYGRTLLDFRKYGESEITNQSLNVALKHNQHVPRHIIAKKKSACPESYRSGHESEAIAYVSFNLNAWQKTEGAIAWLKKLSVQN